MKYYYDVHLNGAVETYDLDILSIEEEENQHAIWRENLNNFKLMVSQKEFEKFWTPEDEERTFRKYDGDVVKFCDYCMNPFVVKQVRDAEGNIVWRGQF